MKVVFPPTHTLTWFASLSKYKLKHTEYTSQCVKSQKPWKMPITIFHSESCHIQIVCFVWSTIQNPKIFSWIVGSYFSVYQLNNRLIVPSTHYCNCTNILPISIECDKKQNIIYSIYQNLCWYDLAVVPNLWVGTPQRSHRINLRGLEMSKGSIVIATRCHIRNKPLTHSRCFSPLQFLQSAKRRKSMLQLLACWMVSIECESLQLNALNGHHTFTFTMWRPGGAEGQNHYM